MCVTIRNTAHDLVQERLDVIRVTLKASHLCEEARDVTPKLDLINSYLYPLCMLFQDLCIMQVMNLFISLPNFDCRNRILIILIEY